VSLKESSDELNPTVVVPDAVVRTPARGPLDFLALAIATVGVGYIPIAPGTWGSLVGVGIYVLLRAAGLSAFAFSLILVLVAGVITLLGIWAASRTERITGRKDPGKVVVDEVAGQLVSLIPLSTLPIVSESVWIIVSFILFRFFDIVKPYPARRMERLHGGLGIMCDDLVAGTYAAAILTIVVEVIRML
jgi:phosphatidylglycerophosphatase A